MGIEEDSDLRHNNRSKSNFGASVLYGKVLALWSRLEEKSVYWVAGTLCQFGHFASLGQHLFPFGPISSFRLSLGYLSNFLILL